jgi:hypothetical protein
MNKYSVEYENLTFLEKGDGVLSYGACEVYLAAGVDAVLLAARVRARGLLIALVQYGHHTRSCALAITPEHILKHGNDAPQGHCTCGYQQALDAGDGAEGGVKA